MIGRVNGQVVGVSEVNSLPLMWTIVWAWSRTTSMARPPRNDLATKDLASRVQRLARRRPSSAKDIELWAFAELGLRVGHESIRKALAGEIDPTQCNVELLMALAAYYEVEPAELGTHAERRLRPFLAFAARVSPPEGGPGLPIARFRCTGPSMLDSPGKGATLRVVPLPIAA